MRGSSVGWGLALVAAWAAAAPKGEVADGDFAVVDAKGVVAAADEALGFHGGPVR